MEGERGVFATVPAIAAVLACLVAAGCGGSTSEGGWQDVSTGADGGNAFPQDGASGANDGAAQNPDGGAADADASGNADSGGSTMDGSMEGDAPMEMDGGEMMDMGGGGMDSGGGAVDAGSAGPAIGAACSATEECPAGGSGTPLCETTWPDGYCLVDACADHGHDCPLDAQPGGGKCVLLDGPKCLAVCASDDDCRTGYACVSQPDAAGHGSATVCVPK